MEVNFDMTEKTNFIIPKKLKMVQINYLVATKLLRHVIDNQENSLEITYGELVKMLPFEYNPRNLDKPLGVISSICKENNLPLISGVVVNGDTRMPGDGFYKEFFPGRPMNEWEEIYKNNILAIKNCKLWKDYLDVING